MFIERALDTDWILNSVEKYSYVFGTSDPSYVLLNCGMPQYCGDMLSREIINVMEGLE